MLAAGTAAFQPQEEAAATFAPKLSKAQGRIDWRRPAAEIHRLIRALVPWPGAFTAGALGRLKICAASLGPAAPDAPGMVVEAGPDGLVVAAAGGTLRISRLQPEGKRVMTVKEFLAGHRLEPGDRLGGADA
jgi:methionyl-tRNA formyltransferase